MRNCQILKLLLLGHDNLLYIKADTLQQEGFSDKNTLTKHWDVDIGFQSFFIHSAYDLNLCDKIKTFVCIWQHAKIGPSLHALLVELHGPIRLQTYFCLYNRLHNLLTKSRHCFNFHFISILFFVLAIHSLYHRTGENRNLKFNTRWGTELRHQITPPTWADISKSNEVHVH